MKTTPKIKTIPKMKMIFVVGEATLQNDITFNRGICCFALFFFHTHTMKWENSLRLLKIKIFVYPEQYCNVPSVSSLVSGFLQEKIRAGKRQNNVSLVMIYILG